MPKPKPSSNGAVAAASDFIQDAAAKLAKHGDTMTLAVTDAEERAAELERQLAENVARSAAALQAQKDALSRERDEWKAKATSALEKLNKLSGVMAS